MSAVIGVVGWLLLLAVIHHLLGGDGPPKGCGHPGCDPQPDDRVIVHIHGPDAEGVATVERWLKKRIADGRFERVIAESFYGDAD